MWLEKELPKEIDSLNGIALEDLGLFMINDDKNQKYNGMILKKNKTIVMTPGLGKLHGEQSFDNISDSAELFNLPDGILCTIFYPGGSFAGVKNNVRILLNTRHAYDYSKYSVSIDGKCFAEELFDAMNESGCIIPNIVFDRTLNQLQVVAPERPFTITVIATTAQHVHGANKKGVVCLAGPREKCRALKRLEPYDKAAAVFGCLAIDSDSATIVPTDVYLMLSLYLYTSGRDIYRLPRAIGLADKKMRDIMIRDWKLPRVIFDILVKKETPRTDIEKNILEVIKDPTKIPPNFKEISESLCVIMKKQMSTFIERRY